MGWNCKRQKETSRQQDIHKEPREDQHRLLVQFSRLAISTSKWCISLCLTKSLQKHTAAIAISPIGQQTPIKASQLHARFPWELLIEEINSGAYYLHQWRIHTGRRNITHSAIKINKPHLSTYWFAGLLIQISSHLACRQADIMPIHESMSRMEILYSSLDKANNWQSKSNQDNSPTSKLANLIDQFSIH